MGGYVTFFSGFVAAIVMFSSLQWQLGLSTSAVKTEKSSRDVNLLPEKFSVNMYRSLHKDLRALSDREATAHYLEHGKQEGRQYIQEDMPDKEPHRQMVDLRDITPEQWTQWHDHGYLYFPGLLSKREVDELNAETAMHWANKDVSNPLVADIYLDHPPCAAGHKNGGEKCSRMTYVRDAPDDVLQHPVKLNNLYLSSSKVRDIQLHPAVVKAMKVLMDSEPVVCNSLSFHYGSQQNYHFDTWYMPPVSAGQMFATWVALDNVTQENGPLSYYPGSHKIKPYLFHDHGAPSVAIAVKDKNPMVEPLYQKYISTELKKNDLKPIELYAREGDVFVWHPQLLHAGLKITDGYNTTRRALVTHYFTTRDQDGQEVKSHSTGNGHWMDKPHQTVLVPEL